jgi:AhpD family alkylhydroperoxidase
MDDTAIPAVPRLDFDQLAAPVSRAMGGLDLAAVKVLDAAGIEDPLRELVRIRVSQLNGCAYCVDMHTGDARKKGETWQRLASVAVWNEAGCFTVRERAAFALAESTTLGATTRVPSADWDAAASVFSDQELAALVSLLVAINAWNLVGVSTRTWPVEYETAGAGSSAE